MLPRTGGAHRDRSLEGTMKRFILIVVVLAGLALGGMGLGAYWAGGIAEREYESARGLLAQDPSIEVRALAYDRGFRQSRARSEVVVDGQVARTVREWLSHAFADSEALTFRLEDTIDHGPVFFAGTGTLGAARIESRLFPGDTLTDAFPALAPDQPLLTSETLVDFDGNSVVAYRVPDMDWREGGMMVRLAGVHGTAHLNAALDQVTLEAYMDDVLIGHPAGRFDIADARLDGEARALSPQLWVGATRMHVGRLRLDDGAQPLEVDGLEIMWTSDAEDGVVHADLLLASDASRTPELSLEGSRVRLRASNIDQGALQQVLEWRDAVERGHMSDEQLTMRVVSLLPEFLRRNPELAVEELHVGRLDDDALRGRMRAGWSGREPSMNNPFAIVSGLGLELEVAGPEAWFESLLAMTNERAPAGDHQTLDQLLEQGLIVPENGGYRSELALRDGSVYANDQRLGSVWRLIGGFLMP